MEQEVCICRDEDDDGYSSEGGVCGEVDCDDSDPEVNPGADESEAAGNCGDGVDNDCDGLPDLCDPDCGECDVDGDGYEAEICCGEDCDDNDSSINPDAEEICGSGVDENCNGEVDEGGDGDGDGYTCLIDCDDTNPDVNPGVAEVCDNGIDDDCDGLIDSPYDPDCAAEFTLDLDVAYVSGSLVLFYTIGAQETTTWANYLVLTYPAVQVVPLFSVPLPVIDPPFSIPIAFPFPSIGWVGIYTGLYTGEGVQAEELVWVDTG